MKNMDLLVVPSVWPEPFGLVGPEAAHHGVPSAAFAVGGIPEWLVDGVSGHLAAGDRPTGAITVGRRCRSCPRSSRAGLVDSNTRQREPHRVSRSGKGRNVKSYISLISDPVEVGLPGLGEIGDGDPCCESPTLQPLRRSDNVPLSISWGASYAGWHQTLPVVLE